MPKVSVIVPVYNVAMYVEKCARSLFEQTLDDMEFLFIDDRGTDNSIDILRGVLADYPNRISQTRILTMPSNGGQAAVRRYGMLAATGDYVIHCDSDDWVDLDLYESMHNKAIADDADIVVCDEVLEYNDCQKIVIERELPNSCRDVIANWYNNIVGLFLHNKLVRRELYVKHDVYPWVGLNMWEDNGIMARLLYYGGNITQIHNSYYHYNRANVNAVTFGYGEKHVNQMIGIAQHLTEFFESKPDFADFAKTVKAFQFLARINLITDKFANIKRYNTTFVGSESVVSELDERAFSSKGRMRFRMVKRHLTYLFVLLFKVYKLLK